MTPYQSYKIETYGRVPLFNLHRAAIKWVFDRRACDIDHEIILMKELGEWSTAVVNYVKRQYELFGVTFAKEPGLNGHEIDEDNLEVTQIAALLECENRGLNEKLKNTLRTHDIPYYRHIAFKKYFPDRAADIEGAKKGQEALKENMMEFPETYPSPTNRLKDIG